MQCNVWSSFSHNASLRNQHIAACCCYFFNHVKHVLPFFSHKSVHCQVVWNHYRFIDICFGVTQMETNYSDFRIFDSSGTLCLFTGRLFATSFRLSWKYNSVHQFSIFQWASQMLHYMDCTDVYIFCWLEVTNLRNCLHSDRCELSDILAHNFARKRCACYFN